MDTDRWLDLFKYGGTAAVVLAAVAIALWKLLNRFLDWAGEQVEWAKPLAVNALTKHTETLDMVKAFCETLDGKLNQGACQSHDKLTDIHDDVGEIKVTVNDIKRLVGPH